MMKKVLKKWPTISATHFNKVVFLFFFLFAVSFSQAQIVINEVKENGSVELKNLGATTIDVSTYWLCDFPSYRQLNNGSITVESGNLNMTPGAILEISGFNFIDSADGELGLYSTNSFGSSSAIVDYIQWGSGNHGRANVAVGAGVWSIATDFIPAFGESLSLQYDGTGDSPSDYFEDTDTLGSDNNIVICNAHAADITIDNTNLNNTTTVAADGLNAVICVDNQDDFINVNIGSGSVGTNSGFIITDAATNEILGLPSSGPFNLNGAGTGICEIWYVRYENDFSGNIVGNSLSDLTGCFDLSNPVQVIREAADGGTVAIDLAATGNPNNTTSFNGDTEAVICVDSQADPLVIIHENPGAENLSYRYVITNEDASVILAISPSATIDLNGAGVGTCQIWGWSYRGMADNGASFIGGPLADLDAAECSDISDNAVNVIREAADGGTVAIDLAATGNPNNTTSFNGDTEAVICVDSQADPLVIIHENPGAENLSYRYVITNEDASVILAISPSATIDLNGAGAGTCQIWGWSYRGMADNGASFIGGPLADLDAAECSDISDNAVNVIREAADGGTVAIDLAATGNPNNTTSFNGDTEAVICVDSQADPLVIIHENPGAENLSYRYVITNEDASVILAISPSATIDLNGAGVGTCQIWGWSYRGMADNGASFIGGPLADLDAAECSDISDNAVNVIREAADGGTVSLSNGDTEISICAGDGLPNPLDVIHENPGAENLSYRYVITDANTGLILNVVNTNVIDLDGAGAGVCEIWGWSYRGVPNNGLDQIGQPLSSLDNLDCSDISDNAIIVTRLTGTDCESLSVDDFSLSNTLNVFPNPAIDIINISNNSSESINASVEMYDLRGRKVYQNTSNLSNALQINISNFESGMYLINITDTNSKAIVTKRIIKR
ncbi:T9SS type A sorting domain-containing protein [uncultured Psychroserpens sp.]|uniref:T9SS type A sorting domain-containing protein n=1 Tax=uncultured Psychroserpens sp. TaxID=255436 RepID=UPI00263498AA|nr:T9SS type A sorting domain-containing protein [uncultured Psychroserpens sp.]